MGTPTMKQLNRYAKMSLGFSLLLIGIPSLFLPMPGMMLVLMGLGLLAAEFVWASRALSLVERQLQRVRVFWRNR